MNIFHWSPVDKCEHELCRFMFGPRKPSLIISPSFRSHGNVYALQVIKVTTRQPKQSRNRRENGILIIKFNNKRNFIPFQAKQNKKAAQSRQRNSFTVSYLCVLQKPFRDKITKRYQGKRRKNWVWPGLATAMAMSMAIASSRVAKRKLIIRIIIVFFYSAEILKSLFFYFSFSYRKFLC